MATANNNAKDKEGQGGTGTMQIVKAQTVFLLSTLTEDNFQKNEKEISSLIENYGSSNDLQTHFLRRLIVASAPSLPPSPSTSLTNPPSGSQSALSLRLLFNETVRLSRDPSLADKFADALTAGLADEIARGGAPPPASSAANANGAQQAGSGEAFRNFDLSAYLSRVPGLQVWQLVTIAAAVVESFLLQPYLAQNPLPSSTRAIVTSNAVVQSANANTNPSFQSKRRQIGLAALYLLRERFDQYTEYLLQATAEEATLTTGPTTAHVVRLAQVVLGEDFDDPATGQEVGEVGNPRQLLAAAESRWGMRKGVEIVAEAIKRGLKFSPSTSPVAILHRLSPHPSYCTSTTVEWVLTHYGHLSPPSHAESRVAHMLFELIEYAMIVKPSALPSTLPTLTTSADGTITAIAPEGQVAMEVAWVLGVEKLCKDLDWSQVIRAFDTDSPERPLPETWGLRLLANVLSAASALASVAASSPSSTSAPTKKSAVEGLWTPWSNPDRQLGLIDRLLFLPSEIFNLSSLPGTKRIVSPEDVGGASLGIRNMASQQGVVGSVWNNKDLVRTLVGVAEVAEKEGGETTPGMGMGVGGKMELRMRVREVLDRAVKSNPELVLIGLVMIERPWNALHSELVAKLLHVFLGAAPNHQLVFYRIWQIDQGFLMAALTDYYAESEINVTRILDIAQDLKILDQVLTLRPFPLLLDIAALSSRREYLNLDKFLKELIAQHGQPMIGEMLGFLLKKVKYDASRTAEQAAQAASGGGGPQQGEAIMLTLAAPVLAIFLTALREQTDVFTQEDRDTFREARSECFQLYPKLMSFMPGNEAESGTQVMTFDTEAEAATDVMFKQLWDVNTSVEKIVETLASARASSDIRQRQFQACFLSTIFDEYRFFHLYPEPELSRTAALFGMVIQENLLDVTPLGVAVRYVLDALRHGPETRWFQFGIEALRKFKARMAGWPALAQLIFDIPAIQQGYPDIVQVARQGLSDGAGAGAGGAQERQAGMGEEEGGMQVQQTNGVVAGEEEEDKRVFTAVNADADFEEDSDADVIPLEPDEETTDKVGFIMNNLAASNLAEKANELLPKLKVEYYDWFANYFVTQRVALEINYHSLYDSFLSSLKLPILVQHIIRHTLLQIVEAINAEKALDSANDRKSLINLGQWLGLLTLAKDKPIKFDQISFKDVLLQGYDSGRLTVALPFVCKTLELCKTSKIFKPPNPWLMGIMSVLMEIYHFAASRIGHRFDIELLCKALQIETKDITPANVIRGRPTKEALALQAAQAEAAQQAAAQAAAAAQAQQAAQQAQLQQALQAGVPQHQHHAHAQPHGMMQLPMHLQQQQQGPFGAYGPLHDMLPGPGQGTDSQAAIADGFAPGLIGGGAGMVGRLSHAQSGAAQQAYQAMLQEAAHAAIAEIGPKLVFNPVTAPMFANNQPMRKIVQTAVEKAVREIMGPVVERSVTIAGISTRDLTTKDFAMEGNEERLRSAAHMMVQNLTGSLASVTSKEPLKGSITTNIRNLLLQNHFNASQLPEAQITAIVSENLDVASEAIEQVAMDRSKHEVDDSLHQAYLARRKHREQNREGHFWDTAAMAASHYSGMLPNPLRLHLGGLQPDQLRVYEDFGHLRSVALAERRVGQRVAADYDGMTLDGEMAQFAGQEGMGRTFMSHQQAMEQFAALIGEIEGYLSSEGFDQQAELPSDHAIFILLNEISVLPHHSQSPDETALQCAQKVVQLLYRYRYPLGREILATLLKKILESSARASKDVTDWFVMAEDERKFDVDVTCILIAHGMINVAELDLQLSGWMIRDQRHSIIDYTARLIGECLALKLATRNLFQSSIEALFQASRVGKSTEASTQLLDDIRDTMRSRRQSLSDPLADDLVQRHRLAQYFHQWIQIYAETPESRLERPAFTEFAQVLVNSGVLRGEDITLLFFRVCIEVSVDAWVKTVHARDVATSRVYEPVDALAKLLIFLAKHNHGPTDIAKTRYVIKIISIASLVLGQSHEVLGPTFPAMPFFRFFSSFLHNLHSIQSQLGDAYYRILIELGSQLQSIRPDWFPGFAFAWTSIISHRYFMPKLLAYGPEGQATFHRLLLTLLRYLAPILRRAEFTDATEALYNGTTRILLVLLHDYPDFLALYHSSLSDAIPLNCIQLQNIILSAFPAEVDLPDAFDLEAEAPDDWEEPTIMSDYVSVIAPLDLRLSLGRLIAGELKPREKDELLVSLQRRSVVEGATDEGERHNGPFLRAILTFLGAQAVSNAKAEKLPRPWFDKNSPAVEGIRYLIGELDPEGRYIALAALVGHLRWPNTHTYFYSRLILNLFAEPPHASEGDVREQIARVLIERIIVQRPHPWGLLRTFFELVKVPGYHFWEQGFASSKEVPMEIRAIFTRVAKFVEAKLPGANGTILAQE